MESTINQNLSFISEEPDNQLQNNSEISSTNRLNKTLTSTNRIKSVHELIALNERRIIQGRISNRQQILSQFTQEDLHLSLAELRESAVNSRLTPQSKLLKEFLFEKMTPEEKKDLFDYLCEYTKKKGDVSYGYTKGSQAVPRLNLDALNLNSLNRSNGFVDVSVSSRAADFEVLPIGSRTTKNRKGLIRLSLDRFTVGPGRCITQTEPNASYATPGNENRLHPSHKTHISRVLVDSRDTSKRTIETSRLPQRKSLCISKYVNKPVNSRQLNKKATKGSSNQEIYCLTDTDCGLNRRKIFTRLFDSVTNPSLLDILCSACHSSIRYTEIEEHSRQCIILDQTEPSKESPIEDTNTKLYKLYQSLSDRKREIIATGNERLISLYKQARGLLYEMFLRKTSLKDLLPLVEDMICDPHDEIASGYKFNISLYLDRAKDLALIKDKRLFEEKHNEGSTCEGCENCPIIEEEKKEKKKLVFKLKKDNVYV